jgi:hypothetical protein
MMLNYAPQGTIMPIQTSASSGMPVAAGPLLAGSAAMRRGTAMPQATVGVAAARWFTVSDSRDSDSRRARLLAQRVRRALAFALSPTTLALVSSSATSCRTRIGAGTDAGAGAAGCRSPAAADGPPTC